MKTIITLALITLSTSAFADVTCTVRNHIDAIACIKEAALEVNGEGELDHSVGASRFAKSKEAFEAITGVKPTATYVGVVEVHYDEDEIMYYQVNRGENVTPELVYSLTTPDIGYEFEIGEDEDLDDYESFFALYLEIEEFHL